MISPSAGADRTYMKAHLTDYQPFILLLLFLVVPYCLCCHGVDSAEKRSIWPEVPNEIFFNMAANGVFTRKTGLYPKLIVECLRFYYKFLDSWI